MIVAVILAAGESSRMGRPKPLLPIKEESFLQHIIGILKSSKVGAVKAVLGHKADEIQRKTDFSGCEVVINKDYKQGQLSSLITAINSLPKEGVDGILLCLVDHPYISTSLVNRMIDSFYQSEKYIIVPTYKAKRGHPVIFSNQLFPELLKASPKVGAREVLRNNPDKILELATEERGIIKDIDLPQDVKE